MMAFLPPISFWEMRKTGIFSVKVVVTGGRKADFKDNVCGGRGVAVAYPGSGLKASA